MSLMRAAGPGVLTLAYAACLSALTAMGAAAEERERLGGDLFNWLPHDVTLYAGANLGSQHVGSDKDLREFNPGGYLGVAYDVTDELDAYLGVLLPETELSLEAGYFRDSVSEDTPYVVTTIDTPVWNISDKWQVRVGTFAGYALNARFVDDVDDFAITIGDFVPIAGFQTFVRYDNVIEGRARLIPAVDDSIFVVGFQLGLRF